MSEETQDDLHGSIPRFEFENKRAEKGWAEFRDVDDLTGADMRRLRKGAGSSENRGEAANAFLGDALVMLVESWEVPGKPDMPIPKQDPKNLDRVPARFLSALEQHVQPFLDFMRPKEPIAEGEPGSPPQPARG